MRSGLCIALVFIVLIILLLLFCCSYGYLDGHLYSGQGYKIRLLPELVNRKKTQYIFKDDIIWAPIFLLSLVKLYSWSFTWTVYMTSKVISVNCSINNLGSTHSCTNNFKTFIIWKLPGFQIYHIHIYKKKQECHYDIW